jgi:acyl carrier protein
MPANVPKNIEEEIKRIIADVIEEDPAKLGTNVNFWNDLGVDSIKAIEITVALEKKLGVTVRDDQIPRISTVGEAVALVKKLLEKKK